MKGKDTGHHRFAQILGGALGRTAGTTINMVKITAIGFLRLLLRLGHAAAPRHDHSAGGGT